MKTPGIIAAVALAVSDPISAQSLADFGHGSMRVHGEMSLGQRPLLIIRADIQGDDNTTHPLSYYENLVFNFLTFPSVNGFQRENSNGRFFFIRAGSGTVDMINGVNFTTAERIELKDDIMRAGHCINAASRAGFNFAPWDDDNNGTITQDELTVLIVENNSTLDSGAARWANPSGTGGGFSIQNSTKRFEANVCFVTQNVSFATLTHELTHLCGMKDLYGVWNQECLSSYLTLASCTITSADNPDTYHLDPWHKLCLGWCEPRIRDMRRGGVEVLLANQGTQADKHVILYDSARGTGEYFILEFRTDNSSGYPGYDDDVSDNGMVIWHVQQDGSHNPVIVNSPYIPDADPRMPGNQQGRHYAVWAETPASLVRGGGQWGPAPGAGAWHSGSITPNLLWIDGSRSDSHIFVRPFAPGASSITVEIISERDTWVDFNYSFPFELGTPAFPWNTFGEGMSDASWGGTVMLQPGNTTETGVFKKRLTLRAVSTSVIIGR